ncbi:putative sensor protein [Reinekea sp. MED297]|uniref:diguanylate cyclase n=2 Tax=Reinekea TaxID=230494 RepID=A4BB60_9GAMM|nr:putative sensor protein [Reinekea sp. MED297] [Reinekea blandensis MED297]
MALVISLNLMLIIIGLVAITRFSAENVSQQNIIRAAETHLQQALTSAYLVIQYHDATADRDVSFELNQARTELNKLFIESDSLDSLLAAIESRILVVQKLYDRVLSLGNVTTEGVAVSHLEDKMISELNILMEDSLTLAQSVTLQRQEALTQQLTLLLVAIFLLALVPIVFNLLLAQRFANRLKALVRSTQKISQGKLDIRVDSEADDEFGLIGQSINHMLNSLKTLTYSKAELEDIVRQRTEELNHQAMHDSLTGVLNRRALTTRLDEEVQRSRRHNHPLTLLFLDLDHFKQVNDHYGHAVGDQILQETCQALTECIRESDVLARYGGEEFAIILTDTTLEAGHELAERLQECFSTRFSRHAILEKPLTMSVGLTSLFPTDTLTQLFTRADTALYDAKNSGRNRIVIAQD